VLPKAKLRAEFIRYGKLRYRKPKSLQSKDAVPPDPRLERELDLPDDGTERGQGIDAMKVAAPEHSECSPLATSEVRFYGHGDKGTAA